MLPAFQAELVERGTLITELGWRGPPRTAQLYRPVGTGLDPITDVLSYAGLGRRHRRLPVDPRPPAGPAQPARHRTRACGSPNTATSARSSANRCPGTTCSPPATPATPRTGAPTSPSIRPDGMRIAVEITGSISTGVRPQGRPVGGAARRHRPGLAPASRWCSSTPRRRTAASRSPPRCGAPSAPRSPAPPTRSPVPPRPGCRERMAAARWQWWFPASRTGSPAFRTLQCVRPTGTAAGPVGHRGPARPRRPARARRRHRRRRGGRELRRPARRPALAPRQAPGTRLRPGAAPPRRHHRRRRNCCSCDPVTMRRTMTEPLSAQPGWRTGQWRDE